MNDDFAASRLRNLDDSDRQYIEQVRVAAGRLGVRDTGPDGTRNALGDVEELFEIHVDVPIDSPQVATRYAKRLLRRLLRWYIRYIAAQVTALGQALTRLGAEIVDRLDEIESSTKKLNGRLDDLAARIELIEQEMQPDEPSSEP